MNIRTLFIASIFVAGCSGSAIHENRDIGKDVFDAVLSDIVSDSGTDTADLDIKDAKDFENDTSDLGADTRDAAINPEAWNWDLPDANFFYKPGTPVKVEKDSPGMVDLPEKIDNSGLGDDKSINILAIVDEEVFAATGKGVFQVMAGNGGIMPVKVNALDMGEKPLAIVKNPFGKGPCVISATKLLCEDGKHADLDFLTLGAAVDDKAIYMAGADGLYAWDGNAVAKIGGPDDNIKAVAIVDANRLVVLGEKGVSIGRDNTWKLVKIGAESIPYTKCKAIASDKKTLVVGCNNGIAMMDIEQDAWTHIDSGIGGLPAKGIRAVAVNGSLVSVAYEYGCGTINGDHYDYYVSHRWLPSDDCRAVALGRVRWFGTSAGLASIHIDMAETVAEKASKLFDEMKSRFVRMDGFLSPNAFTQKDGSYRLTDSDNDGQWTQEAIGGLCFAYSVTHDKKYKDLAWKAMQNMFLLVDVPAVSFKAKGMKRGFVARSLCREDEPCFAGKVAQSNWHLVTYNGQKYYWKDDTSSDEIVGHFFGYPLYYDLCAENDDEKAAVADHALAIANYIVDNGFRLVDLDGKETEYGHWQPEKLAIALDGFGECVKKYHDADTCGMAAFGGGWLNSIEILGLLLSAYHMSEDPKFFEAFKSLALKHEYWRLAMGNKNTFTMTNPAIENHCDEELAMLSFTTLLTYESDPERRAYWQACLKWLYEDVKPERNPLHAGITAIFMPDIVDVKAGVKSLIDMPVWDRRRVMVDNSHRVDARLIGKDRHGQEQFDRVFPYDEIRTMWWDKNPSVKVADKGMETVIDGPMAFLTAYWSTRYAGVLKELY